MRGHTLVELLFVLTLMGAAGASLAPSARRYRERAAVVAAREVLVGVLAEARVAAMESGAATVHISSDPGAAGASVGDSTIRFVPLGDEYGVALTLSRGQTEAEIHFDALGLGRVASQTIGFHRGAASAELVVSSYGRVRRR
jgi:type II secretory pathway pseudopilin PulG